jgi:NitT/TauT family transport system permease protein
MTSNLESDVLGKRPPGPDMGQRASGLLRSVSDSAPQWGSLLVLLVVWEVLGRSGQLAFLPSVSGVVSAWRELMGGAQVGYQQGTLPGCLLSSLRALVMGFSMALVTGTLVGGLMGLSRKVEYFLGIYINALISTPTSALIPVLFLLFGLGYPSRVAVVFMFAFSVITVNTYAGVSNIEPELVEMGRCFGANQWQLFWKVRVPNALPLLMAGLRVGLGRAVKGMVIGEMLIAFVGLGYLVKFYGSTFDMEHLYAVIFSVMVLAVFLTWAVRSLDRRLTHWRE